MTRVSKTQIDGISFNFSKREIQRIRERTALVSPPLLVVIVGEAGTMCVLI